MIIKNSYLYRVSNFKKSHLDYYILKQKNKELVNKISANGMYKNIHKNKRCFILGNGPSLREQDISLLRNEIVFTVNQISRHPDFNKINTNYHFWADPVFFNLAKDNPEDMELLNVFKSINTENNSPVCFLPIIANNFIRNFNLEDQLNISFYYPKLFFYEDYNAEFEFTKYIPGFQTVVQYAIAMAIYMGITEIYLLGCDSTGIIATIDSLLDKNDNQSYAYNLTTNEQKRMKSQSEVYDIESSFYGWSKIFSLYKQLNRYCLNRNIRLVNCSGKTIIDSIPRENYEDVIARSHIN